MSTTPMSDTRRRHADEVLRERRRRGGPDSIPPTGDDDPEWTQRWYVHLARDVIKRERMAQRQADRQRMVNAIRRLPRNGEAA